MMYIIIAVLTLLSYYFVTHSKYTDSPLYDLVKYGLLTIAVLFFFTGYYEMYYLPEQINMFYNAGSGTTINGNNYYGDSDITLAYYFGTVEANNLTSYMIRMLAIFAISFGFVFVVYDYAKRHNWLGQKVGR